MPSNAYGTLLVSLDDYRKIPALRSHLTTYLSDHHPRAITSVDAFKLGPGGGAVVARLTGPDVDTLRRLAEKVKAVMWRHDNTRSIRTDWGQPVKVQKVRLSEVRSRVAGVTRPSISESLAMNFSGGRRWCLPPGR